MGTAVFTVLAACAAAFTAYAGKCLAPEEARIGEIAQWLPDEPSAAGARITDRSAWNRYRDDPEAKKIVALAEKVAKQPVPDMPPTWYLEWFTTDYIMEGDSRRWREPFWKRSSNLQTLLLAECLENKGRFLKRIIQYLELIPTECAWTEPAHDWAKSNFDGSRYYVDLGVAERCSLLAYALDWLKDRVPVSTREKAIAAMKERAFDPYLGGGENWSNNNWNPVCNGCVIRAALALVDDKRTRARFVEAAERTAPFFLNGFRPDGYCGEGLDYWNYGFGRFLPELLDVRRVTDGKVDLGKLPRAREAMEYGYGFQLEPFVTPRFSDGMANEPSGMCLVLGRIAWPDLTSDRAEKAALLAPSLDRVAFRAFDAESIRLHDSKTA
ncbi:MAG TPA: hypothetical protein PKI32_04755, partial [Opitutales bacterium]|nr:hypothetical protein [Opitutales bacterium]